VLTTALKMPIPGIRHLLIFRREGFGFRVDLCCQRPWRQRTKPVKMIFWSGDAIPDAADQFKLFL